MCLLFDPDPWTPLTPASLQHPEVQEVENLGQTLASGRWELSDTCAAQQGASAPHAGDSLYSALGNYHQGETVGPGGPGCQAL